MLTDDENNFSASSCVFITGQSISRYSLALTQDKPSLFRAELWGIILASTLVNPNTELLVYLDGKSVVKSVVKRLS
jgi:hypothetical protein